MKTAITILATLFFSIGFSQIKALDVSQIKSIGKVQFIELNQNNDVLTFAYQDLNSNQMTSFSFKNLNNDLDNLYNTIMNGFENIPEADIPLELPNDIIYLHFEKSMGVVNFQFKQSVNKDLSTIAKSVYLTKKKVNKLFGKNV